MKPNIENSTPKDDELTLDISMLTPEMYRQEKQKKQEELIRRANEQRFIETSEISKEKYDITEDSDGILSLINVVLQNYKLPKLSELEESQIVDLAQDIMQIDFSQWLATGKLPGGTIKNLARLGKISNVLQNVIIPRIKPIWEKYKINKNR